MKYIRFIYNPLNQKIAFVFNISYDLLNLSLRLLEISSYPFPNFKGA